MYFNSIIVKNLKINYIYFWLLVVDKFPSQNCIVFNNSIVKQTVLVLMTKSIVFNNSHLRVAMKTQRLCPDSKGVKNRKPKARRKHIDTT